MYSPPTPTPQDQANKSKSKGAIFPSLSQCRFGVKKAIASAIVDESPSV